MNLLLTTILFSQVIIDQHHYTGGGSVGNGLLNDLQAYWKCNDIDSADFDDATSNNRDLGTIGSVGTDTGALSTSRTYPTGNDYGFIADDIWNNISPSESFTFTCWVYWDSFPIVGETQTIMSKGDVDLVTIFNHPYEMYLEHQLDGDKAIKAYFGNASVSVIPSPDITSGQWYFFAVRYTAGTASISYVNGGVLTHSAFAAVGDPDDDTNGSFRLGAANYFSAEERDLNGARIDEVGFWKRSLTESQISIIYNSGTPLPFESYSL